jgi:hypothetical protein
MIYDPKSDRQAGLPEERFAIGIMSYIQEKGGLVSDETQVIDELGLDPFAYMMGRKWLVLQGVISEYDRYPTQ